MENNINVHILFIFISKLSLFPDSTQFSEDLNCSLAWQVTNVHVCLTRLAHFLRVADRLGGVRVR